MDIKGVTPNQTYYWERRLAEGLASRIIILSHLCAEQKRFPKHCQSQTSNVFPVNFQPWVEGGFLNLILVHIPSEQSCPCSLGTMAMD